jgi:hypothetical protein
VTPVEKLTHRPRGGVRVRQAGSRRRLSSDEQKEVSVATERRTETREVAAADPQLSPETNARLTHELREAVGAERVEVPADRPHVSRGEGQRRSGGPLAWLGEHRLELLRGTAIVLTFAAIVALVTNKWWVLPIAAAVHALGTMSVALATIRLTTMSEHPAPEVAAALSEEGVPSPDEYFSAMVSEFRETPEGGAAEVLSPGENERNADALREPAEAAGEQSSAFTPTGAPSEPAPGGGAPDYLIWSVIASLFVISIVIPAVDGGGRLWLLTAVMVPLLAGWVALQRAEMVGSRAVRIRSPKAFAAIIVCTVVAVGVFCTIVALAFPH